MLPPVDAIEECDQFPRGPVLHDRRFDRRPTEVCVRLRRDVAHPRRVVLRKREGELRFHDARSDAKPVAKHTKPGTDIRAGPEGGEAQHADDESNREVLDAVLQRGRAGRRLGWHDDAGQAAT